MSAWLVSKLHIDALVYGRSLIRPSFGGDWRRQDTSDSDLGRMLWRENMLSLHARYEERHGKQIDEGALAGYSYHENASFLVLPIIALIKAIDCYEYQSCEHEGWTKSAAYDYCRGLRASLIPLLPGYEAAPWGLGSLPVEEAQPPKEAPKPPKREVDTFTVRIDLGNAAMRTRTHIAGALRNVMRTMRNVSSEKGPLRNWGEHEAKVVDVNGNTVGEWAIGKQPAKY